MFFADIAPKPVEGEPWTFEKLIDLTKETQGKSEIISKFFYFYLIGINMQLPYRVPIKVANLASHNLWTTRLLTVRWIEACERFIF